MYIERDSVCKDYQMMFSFSDDVNSLPADNSGCPWSTPTVVHGKKLYHLVIEYGASGVFVQRLDGVYHTFSFFRAERVQHVP